MSKKRLLPEHWDIQDYGVPEVSLTLFVDGDTTITWDQENDAAIREIVQKKMDEGHIFMVIEPRSLFGRMLGRDKKVRLKSADTLKPGQPLIVPDGVSIDVGDGGADKKRTSNSDINSMINKSQASIVGPSAKRNGGEISTVRTARTVDDVVKNHTLAVPRMVGG